LWAGVLSLLRLGLAGSEAQLHVFFIPEELAVPITAVAVVLATVRRAEQASTACCDLLADFSSVDTVVGVSTMNHMVPLSFVSTFTLAQVPTILQAE